MLLTQNLHDNKCNALSVCQHHALLKLDTINIIIYLHNQDQHLHGRCYSEPCRISILQRKVKSFLLHVLLQSIQSFVTSHISSSPIRRTCCSNSVPQISLHCIPLHLSDDSSCTVVSSFQTNYCIKTQSSYFHFYIF